MRFEYDNKLKPKKQSLLSDKIYMKFLVTSHINYKYIKKHSEQFNGCINAGIAM